MTEKVTLLVMVLLAVVFGITALCWHKKLINIHANGEKFILWIFYTFLDFWMICLGRVIVLEISQITTYVMDNRLIAIDVFMGVLGTILFPIMVTVLISWDKKRHSAMRVYILCVIVTLLIAFVYQYLKYRNVNSMIYHLMLPENIVLLGFIVTILFLGVWILISRFVKEDEDIYILQDSLAEKLRIRYSVCDTKEKYPNTLLWLVSIACIFTACGYPVFELFIANVNEFTFEAESVWICYLLYQIALCVFVFFVIHRLPKKIQEFAILLVFAFTLASYIQQMLLNGALFLMDGENRKWGIELISINILIWISIFVGIFVVKHYVKDLWKNIVSFLSIAIIFMQLTGGISLILTNSNEMKSKDTLVDYFSNDGLYEVASEENVIVFVLDKYDEEYMREVLSEEADFFEPLQGFTYFPDTVSQFSRTYPSITYMLTNNTFFNCPKDISYSDWAFDNCSFWNELDNQGYASYFFEEDAEFIGGNVKKSASNYVEKGKSLEEEISFLGCMKSMHLMSSFRIMPYILKDYYSYTAEEINDLVINQRTWEKNPYIVDDAKIKRNLDFAGLSIGKDKRAFRFIHMFGAHPPYSLNRNGERVNEDKSLWLEQYMGSMQIVYRYLEELQKIGAYDNSTIIITADHGENFESNNILPENTNIVLFIKPKGVSEGEIQYSDVYASQDDLLPTIAAMYNIDSKFEVGVDLFSDDVNYKERERYHYFHVVKETIQTSTRTYKIKGSSLDFENWKATEEYHDFR